MAAFWGKLEHSHPTRLGWPCPVSFSPQKPNIAYCFCLTWKIHRNSLITRNFYAYKLYRPYFKINEYIFLTRLLSIVHYKWIRMSVYGIILKLTHWVGSRILPYFFFRFLYTQNLGALLLIWKSLKIQLFFVILHCDYQKAKIYSCSVDSSTFSHNVVTDMLFKNVNIWHIL